MIGEISLDGVYIPSLLLFACAAFVLTGLLTGLLSLIGVYRLVAYRPIADLAIFLLILAAIVRYTEGWGIQT